MTEETNRSGAEAWMGLTALVSEAFKLADRIVSNLGSGFILVILELWLKKRMDLDIKHGYR